MIRIRHLVVAAGLAALAAAPPAAWAQDPIHKASRGILNVLTGWIEIPRQMDIGRHEPNPLTGFFGGFFKGAGLGLLRTGVGLYETVTFPFGRARGFPSPYEDMEMPDYAWE
jgi:putative exosortase-associated protein (TIGR04073 family)